jgi:hypothetical protein
MLIYRTHGRDGTMILPRWRHARVALGETTTIRR